MIIQYEVSRKFFIADLIFHEELGRRTTLKFGAPLDTFESLTWCLCTLQAINAGACWVTIATQITWTYETD